MTPPTLHLPADTVTLPAPRINRSVTLDTALRKRQSSRAFLPRPLSLQEVSALLWAGFGVNRPGSWGRTAPSAHNWQEIAVYALLPEGAYRYDAQAHQLTRVNTSDLRPLSGTQDFVATAPLNLVYVIDTDRMEQQHEEEHGFLAGADVGCIVENVYLYCAGTGLATVVRGLVNRRQLAQALGLSPTQRIALCQTVGHARPAAAAH